MVPAFYPDNMRPLQSLFTNCPTTNLHFILVEANPVFPKGLTISLPCIRILKCCVSSPLQHNRDSRPFYTNGMTEMPKIGTLEMPF